MTLFEFLMAIASVVVAIALTEVFGGWGKLLRLKYRSRLDWLHLSWSIIVVLYAIQYWVGIWPYRDIEFHYVYQVWFLIFPTLAIVLVAFAITPDADPNERLVVRDYYISHRKPIFIGMATFIGLAQLADWIILGPTLAPTDLGASVVLFDVSVVLIVTMLIPAFTTKIWVHGMVMLPNLTILVFTAFSGDFIY